MACPTWTFGGVTREVWECLKREGSSRTGKPAPTDDRGIVTAYGVTVEFEWEEDTATLRVTVVERPDWMDCHTAELRIRQAVRGCGGQG